MAAVELHAATAVERLKASARARFAVAQAGGWIAGLQQFSKVSLCVLVEIDGARLPALADALREAGIPPVADAPAAEGGARCPLQITVLHGEPDLRTPPPAAPG